MKQFDITINSVALDKAVTVAVGEAGRTKFKETYDLFNSTMQEMFNLGKGESDKALEDLKQFHAVNVGHERDEADQAGYKRGFEDCLRGIQALQGDAPTDDEQDALVSAAAALYEEPVAEDADWDNYTGVQSGRSDRAFDVA